MIGIGIAAIVLSAVSIFQHWRQRRKNAQLELALMVRDERIDTLERDLSHKQSCTARAMAMAPGDREGRLLPEARQLIADLDACAVSAKPAIDNLVAVTFSLRAVCVKLESLLCSVQKLPGQP